MNDEIRLKKWLDDKEREEESRGALRAIIRVLFFVTINPLIYISFDLVVSLCGNTGPRLVVD